MAKCRAKTAKGPCGAQALKQSKYCFAHDPASGKARAEARKRGGKRARIPHAGDTSKCPNQVRTIQDVLAVLDYALAEAMPLENSIQRGRLLVAICGAFAEAIQTGEFETRLAAIEDAMKAQETTQ